MDDRRKFRITDTLSLLLSIVTLLTVISGGFFWFYKTNSLPSRVDSVEKRVDAIEKQLVKNDTKTDLIYQAVLEIRSVLLTKK